MFILVPLILIFFCIAYLSVNDDLTIYTQSFIYFLIIFILFVSYYLFKIINKDMKKQELNNIQIEINSLNHKLNTISDDTQKQGILNQINILKREYERIKL